LHWHVVVVGNPVAYFPGRELSERVVVTRFASPVDWNPESNDPRDKMLHGVQVAFGRIYAGGAFGEFPNEALEVARQAAFALIDYGNKIENK
jgi:hypothetical protein